MPKRSSEKQDASSSGPVKDARFANFESNPRFKLPSKKHNKTVIDKRFSRMLKDEDFIATAKVDRYGRKLKSDNKKKALKRIYRAEDDDDEDEKDAEVEDDDVVQRELQKADTKIDPARGGGFSESDSDSDSDEEVEEEKVEAEVDNSASMQRLRDAQADVETGEVTKRIAIVNLDWDHIKSTDLMALFSSFAPKGGRIERVSIYPSEFGKERMQREELEGPPKEIFKKGGQSKEEESEPDSEDDSDEDNDEDEDDDEQIKKEIIKEGDEDDFDSDALRAYQLDRLRYYYAVMVCSDTSTAQKIYDATDGTEYQASSNFIDLRFIPDDVTFDDEPRDECDQIGADYKPTEFITDALQHSKVKLTWDMHPEELARKEEIKRAFSGSRAELEENDMRAYLASDSEDDDGQAEEADAAEDQPKLSKKELKAQKMRELLGLGAEPLAKPSKSGPVGDMQITFTPALMGGEKKKKEPGAEETTLEKYMRKERERKAKKKEMAVAKRNGVDPDADAVEEEGGDESAKEDGDDLGFNDPFFTADEPTTKAPGAKSSERKEERLRRREAKAAEAAAAAAERAQLEEIMEDGTRDAEAGRLGHFDINEIRKAEKLKAKKLLKKKLKGKKKGAEDQGGAALQEGFQVDVADDRFAKLFQDEKFAIDPSHPHFKATEGMKSILEAGRKKRKLGEDDDGEERRRKKEEKGVTKEKKSKKQKVAEQPNDDLAALVESVRRKAKSKRKED
ncbi:pre-rRNA-processing protein esf1 [Diatrype stigma]|uniref:Pre-rRNA-processing protein esf1 n=1 Tax=Diatrype stigma TaxID=117547 RepID=A0AAN9YR07_9PEZI